MTQGFEPRNCTMMDKYFRWYVSEIFKCWLYQDVSSQDCTLCFEMLWGWHTVQVHPHVVLTLESLINNTIGRHCLPATPLWPRYCRIVVHRTSWRGLYLQTKGLGQFHPDLAYLLLITISTMYSTSTENMEKHRFMQTQAWFSIELQNCKNINKYITYKISTKFCISCVTNFVSAHFMFHGGMHCMTPKQYVAMKSPVYIILRNH